jgi:hypothetical protein
MKSQATVHSITRKPNAADTAYLLTITIDNNGKPKVSQQQETTNVATGDQVSWTCTPPVAGTLSLYFDPFHRVPLFTGTGNPTSPINLGPYTVMAEQPAKGQPGKPFSYHISWTVNGKTSGTDPIIIVDPTNTPDK